MINNESQHSIFEICREQFGLETETKWKEKLKRRQEEVWIVQVSVYQISNILIFRSTEKQTEWILFAEILRDSMLFRRSHLRNMPVHQ